jgi:hypothetical protein
MSHAGNLALQIDKRGEIKVCGTFSSRPNFSTGITYDS